MKLDKIDMALINEVYKEKYLSVDEVLGFSREQMVELTYLLGNLIGYDEVKGDIDTIGEFADKTISKLLNILEDRGEM